MNVTSPNSLPDTALIREDALLAEHLPISRSSFRRLVKAGLFPPPVWLSPHIRAWRGADFNKWVGSLAAGSQPEQKETNP